MPAATLAIVVGVGASVFAVVNGTLLRPLPFPEQDRLVRVFTMPPGATESRSRNPLASVDFVRFLERTQTLDRFEVIWQRERSLVGAGDPVIIHRGARQVPRDHTHNRERRAGPPDGVHRVRPDGPEPDVKPVATTPRRPGTVAANDPLSRVDTAHVPGRSRRSSWMPGLTTDAVGRQNGGIMEAPRSWPR